MDPSKCLINAGCHQSGRFLRAPKKRPTETLCFLLTGQADHGEAGGQVHGQCPALGHLRDGEGDDDLGWDVELQGVGAQDAEDVQQLHGLVQPAEGARAVLSRAARGVTPGSVPCLKPTETDLPHARGSHGGEHGESRGEHGGFSANRR